ncbi:nitronate monooxygenase family protein [Ornithobacterium rhinotracheale]|uniref:2-nitropropane dioxygenase-like enzyme n=1 Tax=Ornithobacterium rhinotracheale (strain ATCC 51463 / DSM 15997 / CCUG 23171 / CIP 104009 / LMG 9086) TaxID=867902 RepID=I3ZXC0_ORNRL|nr:nitronate monooxygenase [Ornithobacterium rhinotracheale]AFL96354.1 2-nitropropane dioxygenase-like enzyme [Ornithobacterium rhinotracheale DSM 15997]AIP98591.1 2-nitropropane dioxygenase [Ornithobacterium rhinotracheale ORT-UMN 88]KGB67599.1 2-nitropropane dioxygenase [Ornithobacterium rhinotracheale H06-030791]MCK0194678.1 nitronate monooxygenase [Ornithobacterium rhinotracheale]MCK0201046.1 nitronate monooxygenase [Ornithobacterium rhinotracheale]
MNRICQLFNIQHPIVQGGMVWASGWKLVSAVSNAGGLGILGAGSMYPDVLQYHIKKCKESTNQPFGVNLPLLYPNIEEHVESILRLKVPVVFTSAGSPKKWTETLKKEGVKVAHVVSSVKFALKSQEAGVDAIVAEGFEAGGHNGREETTTFCLIPEVKKAIQVPLIAAGGIATGQQILAAMVLGAEGVQIGTRFVMSEESSAHINFKNEILKTDEGGTDLTLKEIGSVRLIKNPFYQEILKAYAQHATPEDLEKLKGMGRAKLGMFEGDTAEGMLEIGQCASMIHEILPVKKIMENLISEFNQARQNLPQNIG